MAIQRRMYSFDDEKDKDVLDYLDALAKSGRASECVRDGVRLIMDEERVSLTTILEEIREIKRNGVVVSGNGEVKRDEPEDIAMNLERLGL